jgi:twinkle protein
MTMSQLQGNKWPVVSLPSGAGNYGDPIKANIEWLHSFDEVIFCFDMDVAGQENVRAAAELM